MYKCLLLLLLPFNLAAQVGDLRSHILVKDSIIARYNRGDFEGVYALSNEKFRIYGTKNSFIDFLKNVNKAGAFLSSELTEDLGDVKYFKLGMANITVELTLSVSPAGQFNILAINRDFSYDTAYVNSVRTDNAFKSEMDTAIDKAIRKYFRNKNVAGLSLGVIKDGKTFTYNYGESQKGTGQLPKPDTYYEIGSITKTFTGILLAQAVQDKKIDLHDDIRKYLKGDFPNLQFKGKPIQVVHLANHTSRISPLPDDFFKQTPYDSLNPYLNYSEDMFWQALHRVVIDTVPGIINNYSNYGVALLGHILENVYGEKYEDLVKKFITQPMKMNDTKIQITGEDAMRFAQGHNKAGKPTSHWDIGVFAGAGTLRSTINDMLKYLDYNIHRKTKAIALSQRLTRGTKEIGSGLNWGISQTPSGYTKYSHDGGTGGFVTYIVAIPELKCGYILLTNSENNIGNMFRELTYLLTRK